MKKKYFVSALFMKEEDDCCTVEAESLEEAEKLAGEKIAKCNGVSPSDVYDFEVEEMDK